MAVTERWISSRLKQRQAMLVRFAESGWLLDARGVAYLPERDWLVVSDLHFEKGSFLNSAGNPLPALDTRATLARLSSAIADYQPAAVVSLGDSFHDALSLGRMNKPDRSALLTLVTSVPDWYWVEGNHDPAIPAELPGTAVAKVTHKSLTLLHEPEAHASHQIVGHYHPKCRYTLARRRFHGKCFVVTANLIIMPAFGQYTGGLSVDDKALLGLAPKRQRQCYMLYDNRLVVVP